MDALALELGAVGVHGGELLVQLVRQRLLLLQLVVLRFQQAVEGACREDENAAQHTSSQQAVRGTGWEGNEYIQPVAVR